MTWATLKNTFQRQNLIKIRGSTMQNTPCHQANQAIQKLTKQPAEMRVKIR